MKPLSCTGIDVTPKVRPLLDPGFVPAALWNRAYAARCAADPDSAELAIELSRPDGMIFQHRTRTLAHRGDAMATNNMHIERLVKTLLWIRGGSRIVIAGNPDIARHIAGVYSARGRRAFDCDTMGRRIFLEPMRVEARAIGELAPPRENDIPIGRHLDGCRIGFDLGGSDRKAAAVIDGNVVFSEEIPWDPYFQKDPAYHYEGITDSLRRAAAALPRVEAIGGSAAGVYIDNQPRIASLFRGVSDDDFERHVRGLFLRIRKEWGDIPFEVVNDGEVTALAGAMSVNDNALLGISMGTSVAAGYCNAAGHITPWLNELAFVPIDFRRDAPVDEWSGDAGCAVQYLCQQGVARLMPAAGIEAPAGMPLPERLVRIQELMARGDPRARGIYETIGACFGYAIAWYADFYELRNLLLLGRVMSGAGGQILMEKARDVLDAEFPELRERIALSTPDEQFKRHGQAIAAASLPEIPARKNGG